MSRVVTYAGAQYWVFMHPEHGRLVSAIAPFGRAELAWTFGVGDKPTRHKNSVQVFDSDGKTIYLTPSEAAGAWRDSESARLTKSECQYFVEAVLDRVADWDAKDRTDREIAEEPDFPYPSDEREPADLLAYRVHAGHFVDD